MNLRGASQKLPGELLEGSQYLHCWNIFLAHTMVINNPRSEPGMQLQDRTDLLQCVRFCAVT